MLSGIPVVVLQKDFWGRSAIRQRMSEEYQNDTDAINRVMYGLYSRDTITFCGDDFIENLDDDIVRSENVVKGVRNGK